MTAATHLIQANEYIGSLLQHPTHENMFARKQITIALSSSPARRDAAASAAKLGVFSEVFAPKCAQWSAEFDPALLLPGNRRATTTEVWEEKSSRLSCCKDNMLRICTNPDTTEPAIWEKHIVHWIVCPRKRFEVPEVYRETFGVSVSVE